MNLKSQIKNDENNFSNDNSNEVYLETELPEPLYSMMKDFVLRNPTWDQYKLINSALTTFLFENGCSDNSVTELYRNQIFNSSGVS